VSCVSRSVRRLLIVVAPLAGVAADAGSQATMQGRPCRLVDQVSVTAVPLDESTVHYAAPIVAAPLPDEGTLIAWSPSGGPVHLTRVSRAGTRTGGDALVPGTSAHALAVTPRGYAALIRREPAVGLGAELWLVQVDSSGNALLERKLIGGTDTAVVGNEWFDAFARRGRLVWNGRWLSAYYTLHRRWPDGVAHQGDQLSHITPDGVRLLGGWDWGCSHSLDLRLALRPTQRGGTDMAAACLSDAFPGKGIYINRRARISSEPSGDREGHSDARLGGLVPVENGFWLNWTTPEGRASADVALQPVDGGPNFRAYPQRRIWLTANDVAEDLPHLARFGEELLAAWREGGFVYRLARVDPNGNLIGAPEVVEAQFGAGDDFITYASGDVGWVHAWGAGSELKLVRVRHCPPTGVPPRPAPPADTWRVRIRRPAAR